MAAKPKPAAGVDWSNSKLSDAGVSATQITVRKPTAQEFEADLANREEAAAALKEQAFIGVWDLLDFGNVAHNDGQSGIGNAL